MLLPRSVLKLFEISQTLDGVRYLSNKSAMFGTIGKQMFLKFYPVIIVNSDGSTFTIRYPEPKKIIKFPLDLSTLSEEERTLQLEKRKPKKKVVIEEEVDDGFRAENYIKYIRKSAG